MIDGMPRPRFPYLQKHRRADRSVVWYVRKGKGPRIRINGAYGSPEFVAEYHAAIAGEEAPKKGTPSAGTLAWLIKRYHDSSAWAGLSLATRRKYELILKKVTETAGEKPYAALSRKHIVEGRERRKATLFQANNFLKAMRGLFRWALDADLVKADPTEGVASLRVKTEGFHAWTENEIEAFEARWPVGTRERLAFDVLLYSGLRRGDAVRVGRPHVRNGVFSITTEKTGETIVAPLLPVLKRTLDAGPVGETHVYCR